MTNATRLASALMAGMAMMAAAPLSASPTPAPGPASEDATDLVAIADAIARLIGEHHFDPAIDADPAYLETKAEVAELARNAASTEEFVAGFNRIWRDGPFSHVRLAPARASAEETAAYLDQLRVGDNGAVLTWRGDIAVLTVNTMMGLDTIERIDAAFDDIAQRGARALIVDLRANDGGAFAVRPLLAHVIDRPLDGGVFVSRRWTGAHDRYPTIAEAEQIAPWDGWSIRAFWKDLRTEPFLRFRIGPETPGFGGPVYVLTSGTTASAAELASDAFAASGRAVLVGERTAGKMLSQTMFDLPDGLQLSLPIGDYYAFHSGRIEGAGVQPQVEVAADEAMEAALRLAGS